MPKNQFIDRRKAIKQASLLLGVSISGPALTGVLNGCTASDSLDWQPQFFTEEEAKIIEAASSRILPSVEEPGAKDANVTTFIDEMMAEFYLPEDQARFRQGMDALESQSQTMLKKSFVKAAESEQDRVLKELTESTRRQMGTTSNKEKPFFLMLKELTVLGFFTSEVGATQFLNFDEIPGGFQGCGPLEELGGKTWAT